MNWFLLTIIALLLFAAVGKSIFLLQRDTVRELRYLPWDIGLNILLIIWATVLWAQLS